MAILLASIIGLSIEQRHRELALLRTIGATPRQVRRLVVRATMRPAFVAAVAGALLGPALGRELFARLQDGGVVPPVLALRQGVLPIVVGALAALLIARVAAGLAARKAARARLGEALGEAEALPGELEPGPGRRGRGDGRRAPWRAVPSRSSCHPRTPRPPAAEPRWRGRWRARWSPRA